MIWTIRERDLRSFLRVRGRIKNCTEGDDRFRRSEEIEHNPESPSVLEAPRNGLDERDEAISIELTAPQPTNHNTQEEQKEENDGSFEETKEKKWVLWIWFE